MPLSTKVEVGEQWPAIGVKDMRCKGETVMRSGLGGDGGCSEGGVGDDLGEEGSGLGDEGDVDAGGMRAAVEGEEEGWAGAEDGQ